MKALRRRLGYGGIDHHAISIFHQDMAGETELGFLSLLLLGKGSCRIGC